MPMVMHFREDCFNHPDPRPKQTSLLVISLASRRVFFFLLECRCRSLKILTLCEGLNSVSLLFLHSCQEHKPFGFLRPANHSKDYHSDFLLSPSLLAPRDLCYMSVKSDTHLKGECVCVCVCVCVF